MASKKKPKKTAAAGTVVVVNMIPKSLSGETHQDSEPTLAVNPVNPQQIIGTAFTPDPLGGDFSPIYVSSDGGSSWTLNTIVPSRTQTADITVGFSATGKLYAGILRLPSGDDTRLNILRAKDPFATTPMEVLVDRLQVDQPFVQTVVTAPTSGKKTANPLFIGNNDFAAGGGQTATIDFSLNAAVAKAKFKTARIESRATVGQNGPQVRPACHPDGTVYLIFCGWRSETGNWQANTLKVTADVVVVRDEKFGGGTKPFTALVDPSDGRAGRIVASRVQFPFHHDGSSVPGQQRLGGDVAIAVDPRQSATVYVAWSALQGSLYTLHVRASHDRGVTWSANDLLTVPFGINPGLAINAAGRVGLLYQQLAGTQPSQRWVTHLQTSADGATWQDLVLADTPATTPRLTFSPYLGDYDQLLAISETFYGIFSASNIPAKANFPSGVSYQRNADFASKRLLDLDGQTPVAPSIDPFFFRVTV
jgi:hypothetical protein